jgi:hypothetical protein
VRLSTSTTTTPTKSPVLELLQSKKKGQMSCLYQWVLWREALKGEKDRKNEDPAERTCVIRNLNSNVKEKTNKQNSTNIKLYNNVRSILNL